MKWNYWLRWMLILIASPIVLMGGLAVAQHDDACFMENNSGQKVSLNELCGKSGGKAVSDFMWDENNYDPNFVTKIKDGWSVLLGGPHPFKHPTGEISWPDGRITTNDNITAKSIIDTQGKTIGIQYYKEDRVTPLQVGETLILPNGLTVSQGKF
jgi:hypothetical protein